MMPKKQKYKRWQRKGILTKRLLENQPARGKKKQEPEVVALQNDTQECYLKSRLLLKKVIEWDATFTL